jgi:hypothetical protein
MFKIIIIIKKYWNTRVAFLDAILKKKKLMQQPIAIYIYLKIIMFDCHDIAEILLKVAL